MSTDPIVEACVEKLFKIITNKDAGISHSVDTVRAKELFKALHKKGFTLHEHQIYSLAIVDGWPSDHAKKLAQLAAHIGAGKRVVIKPPRNWGEPTVNQVIAEHQ